MYDCKPKVVLDQSYISKNELKDVAKKLLGISSEPTDEQLDALIAETVTKGYYNGLAIKDAKGDYYLFYDKNYFVHFLDLYDGHCQCPAPGLLFSSNGIEGNVIASGCTQAITPNIKSGARLLAHSISIGLGVGFGVATKNLLAGAGLTVLSMGITELYLWLKPSANENSVGAELNKQIFFKEDKTKAESLQKDNMKGYSVDYYRGCSNRAKEMGVCDTPPPFVSWPMR